DGDELSLRGAVEVGPPITQRALERTILVEDDAAAQQTCPRQIIGEGCSFLAILGEVQHRSAPLWRAWGDSTVRKAGSLRVTHTAMVWPVSQISSPASHKRKPSPI